MIKRSLFPLLAPCFLSQQLFAHQNPLSDFTYAPFPTLQVSPWTPRSVTQGLFGQRATAGYTDAMLPLFGLNDRLFYLDGDLMGGQYNIVGAGVGAGARQIKNINHHDAILGGFIFTDYQQISNGETWFVNPGIEILTNHYEARLQAYIPVNHRNQIFAYAMASQIPQSIVDDSGRTNNLVLAHGHSFTDTPVGLTNEYGGGAELEGGKYFPFGKGGWLRAGVYSFAFPNAAVVNGFQVNAELFTTKQLALLVQNNYDNQNKNKLTIGFRLTFGGPDYTDVSQLSNRMEEPVIRHQARQYAGLATPVRHSFTATGPSVTQNGIWYFAPYGTLPASFSAESCTAENPCLNLTQSIADGIAGINPNNASLWFATGSYALPSTGTDGVVSLYNGQQIFGRTFNFRSTASGNDRATINGGLWWNGSGSFNDMQISNANQIYTPSPGPLIVALGSSGNLTVAQSVVSASGSGSTAIRGVRASNTIIQNSTISTVGHGSGSTRSVDSLLGVSVSDSAITALNDSTGLVYGVQSQQSAVTLNNTSINATSTGTGSLVIGAISFANANVTANHSIVQAIGSRQTVGLDSEAGNVFSNYSTILSSGGGTSIINGIFAQNAATVSYSSITTSTSGTNQSLGIVTNTGNIDVSNSQIHTTATTNSAFGISANGGSVTANNSSISITGAGAGGVSHFGIFALNNITASGLTVNANTSGTAQLFGMYAQNGNIQLASSSVNASGGGTVRGLLTNTGSVTFTGGASSISATSAVPASAQAIQSAGGINNNSTPPSQCSVNGGASSNC